ncbi:MAG TPA: lipopolysaccharide assembly protein LapA domain-containing protein [Acidimicrobiia bacterium]|nr:lipopolysaccharide assembly protein LapA domain-containing protein [Acidimicrobiia bacterium]
MNEQTPLWQTRKFRIGVLAAVIGALALTLILQNFDTTEVQFFFWRAEAPLAGVIFTSMLIGAGLQVLVKMLLRRRRRQRETQRDASRHTEQTEQTD